MSLIKKITAGMETRYWLCTLISPVFMLGEVLMETTIPLVMAQIVDVGIAARNQDFVVRFGLLMVGMAVFSLVCGALCGRVSSLAAFGFSKNLRRIMFRKVQDFSFSNINRFGTDSLVTRLTTDITNLQNMYQNVIRSAIRAPIMMVFGTIMAFSINSRLAIIFLIVIPVLAVFLTVITVTAYPRFRQMFTKYDNLNRVVQENLTAIRVVKSFVRGDHESAKFDDIADDLQRTQVSAEKIVILNMPVMQISVYACIVSALWFGGNMVISGRMQAGGLISFISYITQILMSLMMLSRLFIMLIMSRASLTRVSEIIDEEIEIKNPVRRDIGKPAGRFHDTAGRCPIPTGRSDDTPGRDGDTSGNSPNTAGSSTDAPGSSTDTAGRCANASGTYSDAPGNCPGTSEYITDTEGSNPDNSELRPGTSERHPDTTGSNARTTGRSDDTEGNCPGTSENSSDASGSSRASVGSSPHTLGRNSGTAGNNSRAALSITSSGGSSPRASRTILPTAETIPSAPESFHDDSMSRPLSAERSLRRADSNPVVSDSCSDALMSSPNTIVFDNVSFSYDKTEAHNVLSGISLLIPGGSTVGILGGTGSSKSTLVQLIPRLYDVTGGSVSVGGIDVREWDLDALRRKIGFVLQKNVLFSGTIRQNLRWGNESATDDDLILACKMADAHGFVSSFPDGYDTDLSQGGVNLSGGQKQRLCIARALVRKPDILILDDSTSAVDTATDLRIRNALRTMLPHTTRIIIAQRIASLQESDFIVVLDGGKVSGVGKHDELLRKNRIYKEVYESQMSEN